MRICLVALSALAHSSAVSARLLGSLSESIKGLLFDGKHGEQCDRSVASLNVGDVTMELPGKVGFMGMLEMFTEGGMINMTDREEAWFGPEGVVTVRQAAAMTAAAVEYMPPGPGRDEMEGLLDFLTVGRGGDITCGLESSWWGVHSVKAWRPYNFTQGWHYYQYTECNNQGWKGLGVDASVSLDIQFQGNIGYVAQRSAVGADQFIAITSRIMHVGRVSIEDMKSCCYPDSEYDRDCSAVMDLIDSQNLTQLLDYSEPEDQVQ